MSTPKKVIVAVHGIGDQSHYATIQTVAYRFCDWCGVSRAMPLGQFHLSTRDGQAAAGILDAPSPPFRTDAPFAFAEVYWADTPRELKNEKYTLEEIKAWARSVVGRIHSGCTASDHARLRPGAYRTVITVLDDIVDTVDVLERLLWIAEKAGVFKFRLKDILDDYLGDVQVVTEFPYQRRQIVDHFKQVMSAVPADAEIHIISHSEGTVVSLLGLLDGLSNPGKEKWASQVKSFVTLGSPIDKHMILWPKLWEPYAVAPAHAAREPDERIRWINYYDNGDPVGFELDTARAWLGDTGWDKTFAFAKEDDIGFTRYYLPGKAHVDYWEDEAVFRHLIKTAVNPGYPTGMADEDYPRPANRITAWATSWVAPYLVILVALYLGAFFLYKGLQVGLGTDVTSAKGHPFLCSFLRAFGTALLLMGIIVGGRLVHLTRNVGWWIGGMLIFAAGCAAYYQLGYVLAVANGASDFPHSAIEAWLAIALAAMVYAGSSISSAMFPESATKAMMTTGAGVLIFLLIDLVYGSGLSGNKPYPIQSIWPVLMAAAAFLYLWWLAILFFDLTFVWHRYIRRSVSIDRIRPSTQRGHTLRAMMAPPGA